LRQKTVRITEILKSIAESLNSPDGVEFLTADQVELRRRTPFRTIVVGRPERRPPPKAAAPLGQPNAAPSAMPPTAAQEKVRSHIRRYLSERK
jgi:hypothetical protein